LIEVDPGVQLAAAEAKLKQAQVGDDPKEVAIMRKQVAFAQQSLDLAETQVERAVIKAPFAGTINDVFIHKGDTVSPATAVFRLVDLDNLELKVNIDEVDIARVKVGQEAIISVDGLPDETFTGKVSEISSLSITQSGLIMYPVTFDMVIAADSGLKAGMSATADITLSKATNVLLLPNRAIKKNAAGKPVVSVRVNGEVVSQEITTGISDGIQTEVISGLKEGDAVIIQLQSATSQSIPGEIIFGGQS